MAVRTTALLPQILLHGARSLHSGLPGKGSEDVTQRPDGTAGDKFSVLVSSSSPMPNRIQIIHEGNTAANSDGSNELATKANSTSPNMLSKDSIKSTCPNQSSSDEASYLAFLVARLLFYLVLSIFIYLKGWKDGARDSAAQPPDCKIFTKREALRKEEEKLKSMDDDMVIRWLYGLQEQGKELAEKGETLDRKELEHLRRRAMVLESKLKMQNVFIETINARECPRGIVNAGVFPDETYARNFGAVYLEIAELEPGDLLLGIEGKEPLECPEYPNCSGAKADPPMRQVEGFPSTKIVPQEPNQVVEVYTILRAVPYEDDSMTHAKPDTETIGPPMTKPGPGPASNKVLESLSADNDAAKDEMGQIRRVKEALKSREKELEAQAKDRKKRIQELNAPKSERTSSITSKLVLGSVLGFGATMIMFVIGN